MILFENNGYDQYQIDLLKYLEIKIFDKNIINGEA